LGHGNSITQKVPRLVTGVLARKVIKVVSAGYRHSAAVSDTGELYTWGEGDFGRLGHGDTNGRPVPTLVRDISGVGSVACGNAHTLALSSDGRTVWSFGSGDNGKLGHGDTARVYTPKVIDALQGMYIRKVAAGSQFSLALTANGQVSSNHLNEKNLSLFLIQRPPVTGEPVENGLPANCTRCWQGPCGISRYLGIFLGFVLGHRCRIGKGSS